MTPKQVRQMTLEEKNVLFVQTLVMIQNQSEALLRGFREGHVSAALIVSMLSAFVRKINALQLEEKKHDTETSG